MYGFHNMFLTFENFFNIGKLVTHVFSDIQYTLKEILFFRITARHRI
jgi:hypothetical protein